MNDAIITFFASFLIWFMFLGLAVLWVVDGRIKREQALHALASSTIAWVLAEMFKSFIPIVRPFHLNGLEPLTLTIPNGFAFPSSHTAVAFALAVTIWLHDKKIGTVYLVAATMVGVARIAAHVHFPIDIIGGALIGITVAYLVENVHFSRLVRKFR